MMGVTIGQGILLAYLAAAFSGWAISIVHRAWKESGRGK